MNFIAVTAENLACENLCCAIADKKHQQGVADKKDWLAQRLGEGHVFYKLDVRGKVFVEYAPLHTAWVPVEGENYLYIYCLWVSGRFSGQGYAKALLGYCVAQAKAENRAGVCILSASKKTPFLSDKKFLEHFGFRVADKVAGGYELLALSLDGSEPRFTRAAHEPVIESRAVCVFYTPQCPFTAECAKQAKKYCRENDIACEIIPVDTREKAKAMPCAFQNWAVFYKGRLLTTQPLNENGLKKLLAK